MQPLSCSCAVFNSTERDHRCTLVTVLHQCQHFIFVKIDWETVENDKDKREMGIKCALFRFRQLRKTINLTKTFVSPRNYFLFSILYGADT